MQKILLIVRIVVAVVLGWLLLRFVFGNGSPDVGTKLIGLILSIGYGFVLFVLFGWSTLQRVAGKFGEIYLPSDRNFRIMPEYSKAEARLKVGNYVAAVVEYREVIAKFPEDIYGHVQIAVISAEHLNDVATAEAEFMTACAKAISEDALVMAHNRRADFYQTKLQNPGRALEVMEQLRAKVPNPKVQQRVDERIVLLKKMVGGFTPAKPPAKIAFRQADEEKLRQRRGY